MLPGRLISGGSVLNGQVQDAEFLTIKNDLYMSVYRHYDNSNQVASFYKLPLSISIIMISESFVN
jgi:hypothetical protein